MATTISMTGFGQANVDNDLGSVVVEIKSVNHRYLDIRIGLPRELASFEIALTRIIRKRLTRGKIDASLKWQAADEFIPKLSFNVELLRHYQALISQVAMPLRREDHVAFEYMLSLPGVTSKDAPTIDEDKILPLLEDAVEQAVEALVAERSREGQALGKKLIAHLDTLDDLRAEVEKNSDQVVEIYREKLKQKAQQWAKEAKIDIDTGRLEIEVMLYAEKADITEELVRLQTHIEAYREALEDSSGKAHGKTLEFLAQELLRETNTIASKSRNCDITSCVISMKNEIEKIREQVLNVE